MADGKQKKISEKRPVVVRLEEGIIDKMDRVKLEKFRGVSRAKLIEILVEDAWVLMKKEEIQTA